jgi:hypothetical protein
MRDDSMAGVLFDCARCGKRLKARDASANVRCPFCGAVVQPQTTEDGEIVERLEEVTSPPPPMRRPPRKRKRARRDPDWSLADYLWLVAAGAGFLCFLGSLFTTWVVTRQDGITYWLGKGDPNKQLMGMFFGTAGGVACYVGGVFGVKNRELRGRLVVTQGPMAVVLGMLLTFFGAVLGGYSLCGVLTYLASGR